LFVPEVKANLKVKFFQLMERRRETLKRFPFPQILSPTVLIAVLVLEACSASGEPASNEEPTPTPLPTTAVLANPTYTVQRGEVIETVRLSGRIAPVSQQVLFFTIDGRVRTVYVTNDETVQAGTVIADLEGVGDLQQQLDMSQLRLQRSQINAEIAQLNFDLFVAQTPKGSTIYDKRLAIQRLQLELANIDVEEASLGIQELQDSLGKYQLVAPMDGQVISLQLGAGSQVRAYNSIGTVANVNQLEASSSEITNDILNKLEVGMIATLVPASGLGQPVTGSVRRLPQTGASSLQQDDTIRISLDTSPAEAGYSMGDLVNVAIVVTRKEDVLWIPPQTIRTYSGRKFVVVQEGNVQQRVDVILGVIGETRVEIVEGLTEGQVVVSP
jgi:macrolide-specific efflux system membrane fusion protein